MQNNGLTSKERKDKIYKLLCLIVAFLRTQKSSLNEKVYNTDTNNGGSCL